MGQMASARQLKHRPAGAARENRAAKNRQTRSTGQLAAMESRANANSHVHQLKALRDTLNPVQRLRLGANGDLDTQNDDQIGQVVAELMSLDYDSLVFIRGLLDPMDEKDAGYIKLINYELGKADTLRAVSQASYDYGGIFTSASVFLDGQWLGTTEPISHPDSSTQYYQKVLDSQQATELELAEEHNSRNDSEVSTLEEAYNLLYAYRQHLTQSSVVRILVAGTSGPCDGCKKRLEQLRTDALALLPPGAFLSVESSYLNSTQVKDRNEVQTRYGFENQTTEYSARGDKYYNFRYPLARQTAPTTQLAPLQPILASRAASPATDAGIVQRTVAEDLAAMGLASGYETVIGNSAKAQQLIAKADELGVQIRWGGSHAQTTRTQGGNILRITIPQTDSKSQALETIVFELNNAVRYHRFEALSQKAVSGEIADEDEYAREKIKIELEGMLTTGQIGFELKKSGQDIPVDRFFLPTYLEYIKAYQADQSLTRADFIQSQADEVLDRPHQSGSHRKVYTQQFRDLANPNNREARERNKHLKGRAGQILTFAKFTDLDDAVKKFFVQTSEGPEVARWVASQSEATRWQPLHAAFKNYYMRRQADALNNANDLEAAIGNLGKSQAAALFAWIERYDEGQYRNLSQVLGLYLGYYDNKPELLRTDIYA